MASPNAQRSLERERQTLNGWAALVVVLLWFIAALALFGSTISEASDGAIPPSDVAFRILSVVLMIALGIFFSCGFFTLEPNEARVLILFGKYKGTARQSGFHWANPLYARQRGAVPGSTGLPTRIKIGPLSMADGSVSRPKLKTKLSLRAHNFNSEKLKVNDKRGNPVEIAAVVVWRVEDTAQAVFDVENYESYMQMQSESAMRSMASEYAYDHAEDARGDAARRRRRGGARAQEGAAGAPRQGRRRRR